MTKDIDPTRDDETTSANDDQHEPEITGPSSDGIPDGSSSNTDSDDMGEDSASGGGDS